MTEGLSLQEQIQVITYKVQGRVLMAGVEVVIGAKAGQDVETGWSQLSAGIYLKSGELEARAPITSLCSCSM